MVSFGMVVDISIFILFLWVKDKIKIKFYLLFDQIELYIFIVMLYELLMGVIDDVKKEDIRILI